MCADVPAGILARTEVFDPDDPIDESQMCSQKDMSLDLHKGQVDGLQGNREKVLILTSSLLTDRMLVFTDFFDVLRSDIEIEVWSQSYNNPRHKEIWNSQQVRLMPFPEINPLPEFPHNYARRLNEFVWDHTLQPPSRVSLMQHRRQHMGLDLKLLKLISRGFAGLRLERSLEKVVEKLMLSYDRCPDAKEQLTRSRPSAVVVTGPFQFKQPAIAAVAKNLGIPVLALIPSWDNVSTKNRFVFNYDGYIVWNARLRDELHHFYPETRDKPIYVVGAPQFDVFYNQDFHQTREVFCSTIGIDPKLPIVLYALGSPNFLVEHHGALNLAKQISRGELGDIQMVVRPHPLHNEGEMERLFDGFGPRVVVQRTAEPGDRALGRTQDGDQIVDWVNTFRHADIVINLCSTVSIDAALFDRPIINLDFDPQPGQPDQRLIHDINHNWTHFSPVAESGGVLLVRDYDAMVAAIETYLRQPELHREQRRFIAQLVCEHLDGKCGERMAEAIIDFVVSVREKN